MDRVDRHRLPELLEILCRQLDVTRRTVLKGASGISVYKQKNNRSETSVVALCASGDSRAAWDGHDFGR